MQEFLHTKKPAAILPNILFELLKGSNNLCVMQTWINLGQSFTASLHPLTRIWLWKSTKGRFQKR